jgi:hypothetical protein
VTECPVLLPPEHSAAGLCAEAAALLLRVCWTVIDAAACTTWQESFGATQQQCCRQIIP